ncbi:MAG: bifunctional [glutamine synthetase] adenylyltransferase/[glutamine synthetase]-adenylyl-L-tyrosine phosphorylase [Sphingobium sp.]|nr:bifunctional [glutamine synthetase] adenylyltransferase/[glutamine synthetase]-adenylyl-L-tyrosine phosphorylase [Sphingobium sp.]MBP6112773.1 bifunctional [glutamine synthetase] adenylyltransferase/[glutamine synthetase]-adenylyl-L-tyrosine phosphorylase [Sphingobium sp.]MBP8671405.1 bifunctional [glutamine synthetase] adenylyltransferase/[glutamine synthetase]-adenylyl-L-tyrosine phosphorylase [Sphingobium sp.]MBP9156266.1 bifunctional [glutamine synthetase] adenylyltransferase/[glutamine s
MRRAKDHAPFLAQVSRRHEAVCNLLDKGEVDAAWHAASIAGEGAEGIGQALRWQRGAVALVTGVADLAGAWDLDRVTGSLSEFADAAVEAALAAAFAERYPGEEPRGLAVIALGKHGSRELNYSSDIDPILIFDPSTLPCRTREEPVEAAVRLARRMVELLSARDGDGYVFRVDLRLRPTPEATPIALPVEAAISYYESMALGWEQAAFIRARACAGDKALGEYFLQAIRPFIWRRSLDFGAIDAILDISRRIRDHYANGQAFGPGYDLKRGRGGIREVEFFAQVHQLIHGGRQPALRVGATREAVRLLGEWRVIEPEVVARLDAAYVLLRTIEHRLQMVDDRQTHEIPAHAEALRNVARLHGLGEGQDLLDLLRPHVEWVGTNYDRLNPFQTEERLSHDERRLPEQISAMGFAEAAPVMERVGRWRTGSARALRSAAAMEALEKLMPDLLRGLAKAPDPVAALTRFEQLIERLPTAINFFRLLAANKPIVQLLVDVLSYAPPLAEALSYRVDLLDGLIGASALEELPPLDALEAILGSGEAGDDYQMLLDRVRQKVGERRFALGVQVICGNTPVLEIGAGYGRLAEAAVRVLARATVNEFERTHGQVPGGELVIVALGRLGGGVLTYASDLDLIYLFTGDFATESDGRKPLGATQYFNRLAQRIGNALSVPTASGPLYEVDTRLRPFGAQGLLAASVDSFTRYQRENAWVWEHLALTRARPIFGSQAACMALANSVHDVLTMERDETVLIRDAVKMRADMAKHKPAAGPLDVKLAEGGLVDLEFLVQVTQVRSHEGLLPDLGASVRALTAENLLPAGLADAYDLLTRYLIVSRLVSPASTEPPEAARALVAGRCGARNWDDLLARIEKARQRVAESWSAVAAAAAQDKED